VGQTAGLTSLLMTHLGVSDSQNAQSKLVSRRTFIAGMGAAGIFVGSVSPHTGSLLLRWIGGSLRLSYGRLHWDIDPSSFGSTARLRYRQHADHATIRLRNATLPGTNLRVDFLFGLRRVNRQWRIRLDMPLLGFSSTGSLVDWLQGRALSAAIREIAFSAGRGAMRSESGILRVRALPQFTLDLAARVSLDGQVQAQGKALRLQLSQLVGSAAEQLGVARGHSVTCYSISEPWVRPRAYACSNTRTSVALSPGTASSVSGECFDIESARDQLAIINGPATLTFRGAGAVLTPLRFDRAAMLVARGVVGVAGVIRETPFHVDGGMYTASVKGRGDARPFSALFRAGAHNVFEAEVELQRVWLPLAGGDEAVVISGNRPAVLRGGAPNPTTDPPGAVSVLVDGIDVVAMALDGAQITLRRGADLFNMTFQLSGFELSRDSDRRYFIRRLSDGFGHYHPGSVTALLPSQHIGEHSVTVDGGCPAPDPSVDHARFAEPSRIVFKLPAQKYADAIWKEVPLTVNALTDWSKLSKCLSVQRRADVGDDLHSQLLAVGLDDTAPGQSLDEALKRIQASLRAPKDDETSLELAAKLLFSPGRKVIWERPGRAPDGAVPIFGIRIGHRGDPALRVVWSRLLTEGIFPPQKDTQPPDMITLSQAHHWDIVGQTSVYGLPALRRITSDQPAGGVTGELAKVPRGGVVRPEKPPGYLVEIDKALAQQVAKTSGKPVVSPAPPETGISLATTFEQADITLTALGATMRIDWRGDPPLIEPVSDLGLGHVPGFSLERLAYSTWLGRDERIIAADKGFLLPFGFRATLLYTAQRAYVPDPGSIGGTVAIEIKRYRIVTRRPRKTFPALNQPDSGRDWAAANMTLLTDMTPYLVDPNTPEGGVVNVPGFDNGLAFWPQIRTDPTHTADFEWKTQVDNDSTPLVSRMLFIKNEAINLPSFIAEMVRRFNSEALQAVSNGTSWPDRNVAKLFGARRRYADSVHEGDTSFDTDSWLVIARGRALGDGESFLMDARMNGADQPPFYPSILRMRIAVQSIDRLVGQPQGLIVCRPYQGYVQAGFTDQTNDPQIFIEVVSPKIAFDVSGIGQVSGGVAQPRSLVAAISRTTGIIGGKEAGRGSARTLGLPVANSTSTEVSLNFDSAKQNTFSVEEFFNGRFNILGIDLIGLIVNVATDSLSVAPQLIERFEYGVTQVAGEDVLTRIKAIAASAAVIVDQVLVTGSTCTNGPCGALDFEIENVNQSLPANLTFQKLYPDFYKVYTQTKQAGIPDSLRAIAGAHQIGDVPGPATEVLAKGRPMVNAIEALLANPVPSQFEQVVKDLANDWAALQGAIHDGVASVCKVLAEQILARVLAPGLEALNVDEAVLIFDQEVSGAQQIIAVLRDPALVERMAQTLFYDQFGEALLRVGSIVQDLDARVNGRLSLARADLLDAASDLIGKAIAVLANRLEPLGQPNILDPPTQRLLAADIVAAIDQALQQVQPQAGGAPGQIAADLQTLPARFMQVLPNRIVAAIAARTGWFIPKTGENAVQIVTDFTQGVIGDIEAAARNEVVAQCDRVIRLVNDYVAHAEQRAKQSIDVIIATVQGACDIARFNQINEIGLQLVNWCTDAASGVLPVAKALGDDLLADSTSIAQKLADIVDMASTVTGPSAPPPVHDAFEAGRRKLLDAAADLAPVLNHLTQARQFLATLTTASVCAPGAELIRAMDAAARARVAALPIYAQMARALDDMQRAIGRGLPASRPLDDLLGALREFLGKITTIGKAGAGGSWTQVANAVQKLQTALSDPKYKAYVQTLNDTYNRLMQDAAQLRQALAAANSTELVKLVDTISAQYSLTDRRLSAAILQTVAFGSPALAKLDSAALSMIQGTAGGIEEFETIVLRALGQLLTAIDADALLQYLLNVLGLTEFKDTVNRLTAERDALRAIAHASDIGTAISLAQALIDKWQGNGQAADRPLVTVFDQFLQVIDTIFQGKLDKLLADRVRDVVNRLKDQLLEVLKQVVPTKISTGYTWATKLKSGDIFQVLEPDRADHLSLRSNIEFDFLTAQRSASVQGDLQAFSITLPEMVTISFEPVHFTAGTDHDSSFDVKIRGVELGNYLKFLDAVSAWMRPSGSGFYVRPSFTGIQVGYIYASDLIAVGDLEFINIAIEVYARLPFGSGGAKFGFMFASEERPFLIAAPPYGGGGYFLMETDAGGSIELMQLSFVFGAVVAFNFSILEGSGRVVAGMSLTQRKTGLTIQAIFEAVGEGHIACFSLSIYIRIVLTHYDDGTMEGQATFSFTFKVGFFSLSYSVTAERRIAGHGDEQKEAIAGPRSLALEAPVPKFKLSTSAPLKSQRWNEYRHHIALDLIGDT
jgi:hypothetical protein